MNHDEHEEVADPNCEECEREWKADANYAGIPWSVIQGKTKLSDHFSQEYIDVMCGKKPDDE